VVTAGTREAAGRPWLVSPEVAASWHYALSCAGSTQPADHLSCLAEYKGLRPGVITWHHFHLIHRTWARKLSPSFNEAVIVLTGPGITETYQKAHTPLPGTLETENMNADQGFRRAPAKASDLAVGQIAISAALLLFTATALPAIIGRRRDSGKRGAAHARTSRRQAENGDDAFPPEIPAGIGDPWIIGAPRSVRPGPPRQDVGHPRHGAQRPRYEVNRSQHADDYPSWPGRPGPYALHPDHPSWGEGVLTRAGTARKRLCDRTASPAGPSPRPRLGATPNGRRRMTVPAGAAAEHPCGKNRSLCLTADRTASQPRARARSCPRRWRGLTDLPESASLPGPARLLVRARLPGQPPIHPRAMLPGQAGLPIQVSIPVPSRLLRGTSFLA
jgi:hypothetical protein